MQYINFRKTGDKDIVLADGLETDQELYISKLERQITDIQARIDSIPEPISVADIADERVLELIARHNDELSIPADLVAGKAKVQALLDECLGAKG